MKNIKKIFRLIAFSSFALALFSVHDTTLSWFVKNVDVDNGASGQTAGAYFAGGDGTKETPYLLTNQRHFYNLAWLQYLGYFNQDENYDGKIDKQYYFRLSNDIDCKNLAIPPIGTTKYPFLGSFDGGNYTISNFKISDTYSELVSHPSAIDVEGNEYHSTNSTTINYCSIVGTFGVIGSYNSSPADTFYETSIPSLSNLYLDDVTISSKTNQVLVGAIAGYVNATIDNCGVHYVTFKIAENTSKLSSFSNVSDFTLIGSYNKNKYSYDQDSGGSGTDYGTSTDLRGLFERVKVVAKDMIDSNDRRMVLNKNYAIPFDLDSTSTTTPGSGNTTITSSGNTINATYASTISVASTGTNIGYYSGGEIKVYEDCFDSSNVNFDNMKTAGNSQISVNSDTEHINKIKTYLKTPISSKYRKGDTALVLTGTYFGDGSSINGTDFPSKDQSYLAVKDAKVGSWSGDLFIPARGIWIAPTKPGRFEFVAINATNKGFTNASIAIFRLKRSTPKNYSTGFSNGKYIQGTDFSNDMCGCIIYGGTNAYVPYYYGVDVTQDDIDNGYEFFITKYASNSNNPYIVYLDIGTTGSDDSSTTTNLGTFDFVTKVDDSLSKIKTLNSDGTYTDNANYSKSNVTFKIGNTEKETLLAFRRLVESSGGVLYYQSSEILSSSSTGAKSSAKDEKCEATAS